MSFNLSNSLAVTDLLSVTQTSLSDANSNGLPTNIQSAENLVAKYLPPCQSIDAKIIPIINDINRKKKEIVDICALAAALHDVPHVGINTLPPLNVTTQDPECTLALSTQMSNVISVYFGANTVGTTTATTTVGTILGSGIGGDFVAIARTVSCAVIRQDTIRAHIYPNLENSVWTTDNPMENPSDSIITANSNLGIGQNTVLYTNDSGGSVIGNAFAILSSNGNCAGWASSITTIISQIGTLRSGISSYTTAATSVKGYRYQAQLEQWSLRHVEADNTTTSANHQNIINIINNPGLTG
jgi:hypothetical protein